MSILLPAGVIVLAGLLILSAISMHMFWLQLAWIILGAGIIFVLSRRNWSGLLRSAWLVWGVYALTIGLLVLVLIGSPAIRNKHSWLVLGPVEFQPVELAKVALVLVFAGFFSRRHIAIGRPRNILVSFLIFALPAGLTLLQPDLGSVTILFGIWFGFLLVSGIPRKWLIISLVLIAVAGLLGWHFFLKPYQKARIAGVFYPERDALGINYQTIQSKIAIGSAGFFGKGWGQGTEAQLGFLTEPGTDFVLASFVEEWGLLGAFVVLGAFLALIWNMLRIGMQQSANFEHFVVLGTAIVFGLQFMVNAGSVTGLFPVVGVTFPFLSYGGSSLLADFILLGLVYAIYKKQSI